MDRPRVGVVVPVYNEQACILQLRDRLGRVLDRLGHPYDVYFIDDGSTDDTPTIIRRLAREDARWHGVFLARNFGHQAAVTAGLKIARGDVLAVMDGDLQDQPEAIPELLAKWHEGFDTVYAVRIGRKEGPVKRLAYWVFYRLLCGLSEHPMVSDAGDFSLMDRRVVDALNALPERNRFVRGLRAWVGFRQTGVMVERAARAAGKPKYTLVKLLRLATEGLLDFSWVPLRVVSIAGLLSVCGAFIYLAVIVALKLLGRIDIEGWTTVVFLQICLAGMILVALGIIGEYLGRTYAEVKRRPSYIIAGTTDDAPRRPSVDDAGEVLSVYDALTTGLFEAPEGALEPVRQEAGATAKQQGPSP